MDKLAYELAELLDTSVDKVAGVYPVLKDQIVTYRLLGIARELSFEIAFATALGFMIYILYLAVVFDADEESEDYSGYIKRRNNAFKITATIVIGCLLTNMVVRVITPMLTPDILMLQVLFAK